VKQVSDAYLEQAALEPDKKDNIQTGHRNFLLTAVYFLYTYGRETAAKEWFAYTQKEYPAYDVIQGKSMEDYAFERVQEEVGSTDPNRIRAVIEGYLERHFIDLAIGEEDHGQVMLALLAIGDMSKVRVGLPPFQDVYEVVLKRIVSPEYEFDAVLRAQLLTRLGLPQDYGRGILEVAPTNISTNTPASTNATGANPAGAKK
jgi:hypothetical protein